MSAPLRLALLAVALVAAIPGAAGAGAAPPPAAAMLVELHRPATGAALASLRQGRATLVERTLNIWSVPPGTAAAMLPALRAARLVRLTEPDRRIAPLAGSPGAAVEPGSEWWLRSMTAGSIRPPGPGKPVTVVDTGVDVSIAELAGRRPRLLNEQRDIDEPGEFHGTAVTSLIAARGAHIVGIYPNAVVREWDASPQGQLSLSEIIAGIDAASHAGPGVINLSLGGPSDDRLLREAILDAVHRGSLVVAAQGEDRFDGSPPAYPADDAHVLTVVAVDRHDQVYIDSNGSEANDLSAPGVKLKVAVPLTASPTGYETITGNSFAAALVSGAAAWVWTRRPSLDPTQLYGVLVGSARRISAGSFNTVSGYGLLDVRAALAEPAPPPAPFEPNDEIRQVEPGGLFAAGEPLLVSAAKRHASVAGALYLHDNPRDVYRVRIPAHGRLTATATPARGKILLQVWRPGTRAVLEGGRSRAQDLAAEDAGPGRERVDVRNDANSAEIAYVAVSLDGQTARYALSVST